MKKLIIAFIALQCTVVVFCADPIRPDPTLTPGDTVVVTIAQICKPGYSATVRNVPQAEKLAVYKAYGITPTPHGYEIDHLISLELGGSNDAKNLWPQSYAGPMGAYQKDRLENALHYAVCHGTMALEDAQQAIRTDWIAEYQRLGLK